MFDRHCSVCHNADGRGNGPIVGAGKFPMGPSLITPGRSPGYVYGIIRAGRGMMPSYGARTSHTDRWAIATYVQQLQQQAGTTPAAATATTPAAAPAATPDSSQAPAPAGQENQ
jgi:mono/diheme cytochrome c family protein